MISSIAKLFYIDKVKQNEIAKRFNLTPMSVSRILKEADKMGIVQFHVKTPTRINNDLGKAIKDKYKLSECIAVKKSTEILDDVGQFLANYVLSIVNDKSIIGLSWGNNIYHFAKNLPFINLNNCEFLQITGGFLSEDNNKTTPNNIFKILIEKLGCTPRFLNAPFFIDSEFSKAQILKDPSNKKIFELAKKANVIILGATDLAAEPNTLFKTGLITKNDILELKSKGAIGELGGFFVDKSGNIIEWSKGKLYVSVPLSILSKSPNTICVAADEGKLEILKATAGKGYYNILVTSEDLAEQLL